MSKLRLDYVSPLPPVRSGIADYSRDLLPHLEPLCDLRVLRVEGQNVSDEMEERWSPEPAASCGEGGRLPLFQMGNNRYHDGVLELALKIPGVVTLHDLVLHHLLTESTLGKNNDFEAYSEGLQADHGWVGERVARARRWGELGGAALFELAAHRRLIRRQRGILVHSRWAAERIREEDPDIRVVTVPMGVPLPPPADVDKGRALRSRLGIGDGATLLGSFGFQTPIKRTEHVIAAMARPELASAHLLVAGEVAEVLDLEGVASEAGVADRVHFAGFLDYDEFEAAIAACDLCVNLRYPTAGETSASMLRVMAVGRAVVVSDYAQFTELPDGVAIKAPLGEGEVEGLAAGLGKLLGQRERLEEMGAAAREFVRDRHDPPAAAAAVVAACEELADCDPPGDAEVEAPPPTTLTWGELSGDLEVEGAEGDWGEGEARKLKITLANTGYCRWLATRNEPGGVLVEIQWRKGKTDQAQTQEWAKLPRDVGPDERYEFEFDTRRPHGAGSLLVEPHVIGVSGFSRMGGPVWVREV